MDNKVVPINAEAPRTMTRDERRIIFEKLNDVYVSEKVGYMEDWNDEKVAKDLGVARAWVSGLREEMFVPGHGLVCDKRYLNEQGSFIREWMDYVRGGIGRGMNKEECVANLTAMTDRYSMDVGQDGMSPHVMRLNVANLYDYLTGAGIHKRS